MVAAFMLEGQSSRPAPFIDRVTKLYGRILGVTLRHRLAFVVSILLMFGGSMYLFTTIERSFSSHSLEREVIVKVDTPRQYSLAQIESLYREVYDVLDAHREQLDIANISYNHDRGTGRSRATKPPVRQFKI